MFTVNGILWRVYFVEPDNYNLRREDGSLALGCCDLATYSIFVNKMLKIHKLREVVIHEILHAVIYSYNIILTTIEEERVANIISLCGDEIITITDFILNTKGVS